MSCKCNPLSPFLWKQNPRPSIFVTDIAFRPKNVKTDDKLTKAENIVAYKQFSIHSRAHPLSKPTMNKHEL